MAHGEHEEQIFESIFEVTDHATEHLHALTKSFEGVEQGAAQVKSAIAPLNELLELVGVGLSLHEVVKVGSQFEELRLSMAQTARNMGVGGDDFAESLENADTIIEDLELRSAHLPGSAEDYAKAMQLAGAEVQKATGDYEKSFDLVTNMTAVGMALGQSAEGSAHMLNRLLDSERGMLNTRSADGRALLNAMRQLPGYAHLTAEGFSKMGLEERTKIVTELPKQFEGMLEAATGSWKSQFSKVATATEVIFRRGTEPLFEGMKDGLHEVLGLLVDSNGELTSFAQKVVDIGKGLSGGIVAGVKGIGEGIGSGAISPAMMGGAVGGAAAIAEGGALPLVALGAGLAEFLSRTDDVNEVLGQLSDMADTFLTALGVVAPVIDMVGTLIADAISGILPAFLSGLNMIGEGLLVFLGVVVQIANELFEQLQPALMGLWEAVGDLFESIGAFLGPIIKILGFALYGVWSIVKDSVVPAFMWFVDAVRDVITDIAHFLKFLGGAMTEALASTVSEIKAPGAAEAKGPFAALLDAFKNPHHDAVTKRELGPGSRGGGGRAVQDFRFSKFEISQKFAEGFDPDRIAVAFASDLGKVGERKMQSGFAPLFSVGV